MPMLNSGEPSQHAKFPMQFPSKAFMEAAMLPVIRVLCLFSFETFYPKLRLTSCISKFSLEMPRGETISNKRIINSLQKSDPSEA